MELKFSSNYQDILDRIDQVNPLKYGRTRNYIHGDVSYLSPYISRGVISTRQVLEQILAKDYQLPEIESFVKELCWRDYFQRVGQTKDLNAEIKQVQQTLSNHQIPTAVVNARTGIEAIDTSIKQLYTLGYMHNHCRMYTASIVCNIAQSHWLQPARWMYYHLLDGDWASNACSWQWVAAANSSKKYLANQENINKYTNTNQTNTFLDTSYEELEHLEIPLQLRDTQQLWLQTELPHVSSIQLDSHVPCFIYNYYNLDINWHNNETGNRILLLEPAFFNSYPISQTCMDFMLALSKNIPHLQVYVGSFESLKNKIPNSTIYYKEHPLNIGYSGIEEPRDWITENVTGYYPSFFAYWKAVEKQIQLTYCQK